jgi:hypothetical protein
MPLPSAEMIERAARAMCLAHGYDPEELMANDGPRWKYYEPSARAAITAILPEVVEALTKSQQALAMLVEPEVIKQTSIVHAWAQAVEAEESARKALAFIIAPESNDINELSQKSDQLVTAPKEQANG